MLNSQREHIVRPLFTNAARITIYAVFICIGRSLTAPIDFYNISRLGSLCRIVSQIKIDFISIFLNNRCSIFTKSQLHLFTRIVFERNGSITHTGQRIINDPSVFMTPGIHLTSILLRKNSVKFTLFQLYVIPTAIKLRGIDLINKRVSKFICQIHRHWNGRITSGFLKIENILILISIFIQSIKSLK